MVSWDNNHTVQHSRAYAPNGIVVEAGYKTGEMNDDFPRAKVVVPEFLSSCLVGARVGDRLMVIFSKETADLPPQFEMSDAYVLVVDLLECRKWEDIQKERSSLRKESIRSGPSNKIR